MNNTLFDLAEASSVRFGTSGVRGLVASMTDEVCYAYVQAFLSCIAGNAVSVVVGHDLRPSSPRIAAACIQAIRDSGREPVFVGALPTPAVANYSALNRIPGIIVTGSHIPFDRNGIKFYRDDGEIDKQDEQAILAERVTLPVALAPADLPPVDQSALRIYIERYTRFFGSSALVGRTIALYEHSSVARDVLRTILSALGAEVLSLGRTDTFVPIDTEAVRQEDIEQAKMWAREHRFDAILSTDGDGDRPLIGDENGEWLRGDVVGILCAQFLRADTVVTPVSSNTSAEKCGAFSQVVRTRIGSPYVIAGMESAVDSDKIVVGYEANGGFLLGSDIVLPDATLTALPTRDAVLPMIALLSMASAKGCSVSSLAAELPNRFTASDRIQLVPAEASARLLGLLSSDVTQASSIMAAAGAHVIFQDETDGLRLTFDNGDIVHLRPSGNAPELRCYAESSTQARAQVLCDGCLGQIVALLQKDGVLQA